MDSPDSTDNVSDNLNNKLLKVLMRELDHQRAERRWFGAFTGALLVLILVLPKYSTKCSTASSDESLAHQRPLIGDLTITNDSNNSRSASARDENLNPLSAEIGPKTPKLGAAKATRPALRTESIRHAEISPEDQAKVEENCFEGMPKRDPRLVAVTDLVCREGYVLEHSATDKIALWVSEHVTADEASGSLDRSDRFFPDPLLPKGRRAELADYKGYGYDRGHLAPAGNQNSSQLLKDETFALSNMAPQLPGMNRKIWKDLEHIVKESAIRHREAWVISGPMFYDPKEDDPQKADGVINYLTIGPNTVAVPTHFFKIVIEKTDENNARAIAFVVQNKAYKQPWNFEAKVKPIRWIEERVLIDFMPDLDPAEADRLEATEGNYRSFFGPN